MDEMQPSSPFVVAVVLTWNDTELTRNCLQSVLASDYPNLKVLLVDNGSEPPRGPELAAEFPDIELLQIKKPVAAQPADEAPAQLKEKFQDFTQEYDLNF